MKQHLRGSVLIVLIVLRTAQKILVWQAQLFGRATILLLKMLFGCNIVCFFDRNHQSRISKIRIYKSTWCDKKPGKTSCLLPNQARHALLSQTVDAINSNSAYQEGRRNMGKVSAQPHTIVKQICFPNGNVLFFSLFSLSKN